MLFGLHNLRRLKFFFLHLLFLFVTSLSALIPAFLQLAHRCLISKAIFERNIILDQNKVDYLMNSEELRVDIGVLDVKALDEDPVLVLRVRSV